MVLLVGGLRWVAQAQGNLGSLLGGLWCVGGGGRVQGGTIHQELGVKWDPGGRTQCEMGAQSGTAWP